MVIGVTYDEVDVPGWMLWVMLGWAIARLLIDVVLTAYRHLSNYCTAGNVQTMKDFLQYTCMKTPRARILMQAG